MNYGLLRKTTTARQVALQKELDLAKATVIAAEKELVSLAQIIGALKGAGDGSTGAGRSAEKSMAKRRKGGKWRPGHPGRPPKWYTEKHKAKGNKASKATKPARKSTKAPKRKKRAASPKMLAALARAREVMAAKRAAAKAATASSTTP